MSKIEQHHSPTRNEAKKDNEGIAIIVNPLEGEDVYIKRTPEGGYTIFLRGDIAIAIAPSHSEASESPVSAGNELANGLVLDRDSSSASAPVRGAETPPPIDSPTPNTESENRKFELTGNVVYDPYYKVRKSGKRIADFTLATHDKQGATRYWKIRSFDDVASRVKETVRRGQTGVECVVYGPKYWQQKKKTPKGWTQETVKGYYAGTVRVPK